MRTTRKLAVIALAVVATWLLVPSAALAGVSGSAHDFRTDGASSLCVTCHVPHRAGTTLLIWNHQFATTTYSWDVTLTTAGTTLSTLDQTKNTVSYACLSCHDGTVGVGDLISPLTADYAYSGAAAPVVIDPGASPMKGNHPVGVPYPAVGAGFSGTYNAVTSQAVVAEYKDPGTNAKFYNDGTLNNKGVECGSCHDPHDDTNAQFLRAPLTDYCIQCHIK